MLQLVQVFCRWAQQVLYMSLVHLAVHTVAVVTAVTVSYIVIIIGNNGMIEY